MPLCWIQSQDISIDASVTVDNTVISAEPNSTQEVSFNSDYLPLMYTALMELEKSEVIIDSLRLAYEQSSESAKYYAKRTANLERQKKEQQKIISNLKGQIDMSSGSLNETQYQLKKWKLIGKAAIVAAGFFGIVSAVK